MIRRLAVILMIFLTAQASAQTRHIEKLGFESRRDRLLSYYASRTSRPGFQGVCAKLATGIDEENALALLREKIRHPTGDMFFIYPLIGTYLHFQHRLPEDIIRHCRMLFRDYTAYRGDTENHWLMYYTAILLAAQTWPGENGLTWFNGKSSEENYREAYAYLQHWIRETTTRGQMEFDSPDYGGVFLSPIALLYDFAVDPLLRQQANMLMDYLLADWACEHLKGMPIGGFSRIYEPRVYTPRASVVATLMWLYFGDSEFNPNASMHESIFPALSGYRCPNIIVQAATDRSIPYTHLETKRVRNIIRYGRERNPPVYKTNYVTRLYGLGSLQGGILQPIQQHTWSVTWVSEKPHSTLFSLHPTYSVKELAAFFPEEPKYLVGEVIKSKGTYTSPDKWTGGSPYEQTFQHENALIVLYDIPKGINWPYISAYFPKQLDERIEDASGWIFCREGGVYIAYFPLKPYEWKEESTCHRLTSRHLHNGLVLEAGSEDEYTSFDSFQKQIRNNLPDLSVFDDSLSVSYVTSRGNWMEFTFNGPRKLNGVSVDLSKYPLFESPYLYGDVMVPRLEIRYGSKIRILDFEKNQIKEKVISVEEKNRIEDGQ
ncbi:MAG TPA: hypothetical protein ENN03_04470 [bacterium]|nr:hypothetical protein [bacterium]